MGPHLFSEVIEETNHNTPRFYINDIIYFIIRERNNDYRYNLLVEGKGAGMFAPASLSWF